MRIVILLGAFLSPPPAQCGAVEMIWTSLAHAFALRGHEVTVVCRDEEGLMASLSGRAERYRLVRGFKRTKYIVANLVFDLIFSARALNAAPPTDLIVLNTFFGPILSSFSVRKKPVTLYSLARFPKGQFALYRSLDGVVAVSNAVAAALLRQAPAFAGRTQVVPNPINTEVFSLKSLPASPANSSPVVLYTGRIHPEKGLQMLVEACALLKNDYPGLILRLIGESDIAKGGGGPSFLEELRKSANTDLVLQIGAPLYDRNALATALRSCDVYCYPSIAESGESFGVAPLEAMGVGCAVVVSDLACFRDFIRSNQNALCFDHRSDGRVTSLRDALALLLGDRSRAETLGRAAAADAQRFSVEAIAHKYECLFTQAFARKNCGPWSAP
jgi:glycosyltransferase involved in cell wall biosynthesis